MSTGRAFLLFLVVGLALAWRPLQWPFVNDDLHMVRTFTASELARAWMGHWEPDGIGTPGFRPLTTAFNHLRGVLCGESVAAHRVLLVALFAYALALLVPLGAHLGLAPRVVIAAGVLMLTARYSIYHYVFITDGNHLLQGLAFVLSALLLLQGLARGSSRRLGVSLLAIAVGLCVREDTLAALPALALLALAKGPRRAAGGYSAALAVLGVAVMAWRRLVVPEAQPLALDFVGFARGVYHGFALVGVESFDLPSGILTRGWWAWLGLTALALVFVPRPAREWTLYWAGAAVAACSPALRLQRDDLLFFPTLFVSLSLATAWSALWDLRPALRAAVVAAAAWAVAGGAWTGALLAENFHPHSTQAIEWNSLYLYGRYSSATIPPARRARAAAILAELGVYAGEHPRRRVWELIQEAKAARRRRPTREGLVFFPLLPERLL